MVAVLISCGTAFMVLGSGFVVIAFDTNGLNYLILGSFLFAVAIIFYALGITRAKNDDNRQEQRHQELLEAIKNIDKSPKEGLSVNKTVKK
jgi:Flp pilus assembly protein TadB